MTKNFLIILLSFLSLIFTACNSSKDAEISLAGDWQFALDPNDKGIDSLSFNDTIKLPGSLQNQGFGNDINVNTKWTGDIIDKSYFKSNVYASYRKKGNIKVPFWLNPLKHYVGAAWYRHEINIPSSWKKNAVSLSLERPHFSSTVYLDGICIGSRNSLSTYHNYNLNSIETGKHILTIKIDNRIIIPVGCNSHSVSDHTQTNWNGIIGFIKLKKSSLIHLDNIRIDPNTQKKDVHITCNVINGTKKNQKARLNLFCKSLNENTSSSIRSTTINKVLKPGVNKIELNYAMSSDVAFWDEFHPNLYSLEAELKTREGISKKSTQFGMREIKRKGRRFTINNRPIFLRGNVDCCVFPYTGYPSMDEAYWTKIYSQIKNYGLNHVRFHSWCPPEVAFNIADKMGIYLQIECNSWSDGKMPIGDGTKLDKWMYKESTAILKLYGNHPSFCFMDYGNEPSGKGLNSYLTKIVKYWQKLDNRRMYTGASGWPYLKSTDYYCNANPRIQRWGEGLNSIINKEAPCTTFNFDQQIQSIPIPYVSHEVGQWCVYPNFKEIAKYTGLLRAKNFEIFQQLLKDHHMENLSNNFFMASGKLQTLCYKADIEAALRTPEFAGFQLLGINDFPGQGTALVGTIDPFWDSKAYSSGEEYSKFCNSTVPLAIMKKMIWKSSETFNAEIQVAHFGEKVEQDTPIEWRLTEENGKIIKEGILYATLPITNCIKIGKIAANLKDIAKASQLTLSISIPSLKASNDWHIWVYPTVNLENGKVFVTSSWKQAQQQLAQGKKVMLTLQPDAINDKMGGQVKVGFSSIFWNTAWTSGQPPHTLGIFCDPKTPALANFPTNYYSDYQWWDIMSKCSGMILDHFPTDFKPLVYIIDDWFTNHKLSMAFEAKVGNGSLLVTSVDFKNNLDTRLSAKQFYYSLLEYMKSNKFQPTQKIDAKKIGELL